MQVQLPLHYLAHPINYGLFHYNHQVVQQHDNYDSTATIDNGLCVFGCIEVDTSESFENGQGITWVLDPNNDIDWTNRSGGTSSPQTGPTGAYDGSYYMYTEASGNGNGYPNKEAIMYENI